MELAKIARYSLASHMIRRTPAFLLIGTAWANPLSEWFAKELTKRAPVQEEWVEVDSEESSKKARGQVWEAYRESAVKHGWKDQFPVKEAGLNAWVKEQKIQPLMADLGEKKMPYVILKKGQKPERGWPIFFALHGGGGNAKAEGPHSWQVNTREWFAQMQLTMGVYEPDGLYVIPRMADDREGRWYYGYNQVFLDRMIQAGILFGEVDPNRIYLMGISEGGYTAFRLGSLMADRWAGSCAMAAAEPLGNAPPENLRHVAFRCGIGEKDTMFDRIGLARTYFKKLTILREETNSDYKFFFDEQKGKGHGINYKPGPTWISKHTRNPVPKTINWTVIRQHDRSRQQLYWLALIEEPKKFPLKLTATIEKQTVKITSDADVPLKIYLDDRLLDLDQEVIVQVNEQEKFRGKVPRTLTALMESTGSRGDPELVFSAQVLLD